MVGIAARCLHGAGVCVIPMPANDHRPLALRHKPLAAVSALLILSKILALLVFALTPVSAELSTITSDRIVQLTNNERVKAGLAPLKTNAQLTQAALQKGSHMLEEDYFAHISPSGVTPWFWMSKTGYGYQVAGENLAIDFFEAEDVVQAWMNSPSHRDNILQTEYTETGVAVVTGEFQGGTSIVVVHMFGKPLIAGTTTQSPTPTPVPATPTPSAPPEITPTPLPSTLPAPRTPRIALQDSLTTVREQVALLIEGSTNSTVYFVMNNRVIDTIEISSAAPLPHTLDVTLLPDGPLTIVAYSENTDGRRSTTSTPLTLIKDTSGPMLASTDIIFVISPLTDTPEAILRPVENVSTSLTVAYNTQTYALSSVENLLIPVTDTSFVASSSDEVGNETTVNMPSITPSFASRTPDHELTTARSLSQLTQRLIIATSITLAVLLMLAVMIRIRIQHPHLITHTTLVLLLASLLFFL